MVAEVMRRIYGSDDLFPDNRADAYHAYQSVNYVTSHDSFTLYDLVSYDRKHNWQNGNNKIIIRTVLTRTTVGIVGKKEMKLSPRQSSPCENRVSAMVKRAPARRRPRKAKPGTKSLGPAECRLEQPTGATAEVSEAIENAGGVQQRLRL
jgi:hypothetical protein